MKFKPSVLKFDWKGVDYAWQLVHNAEDFNLDLKVLIKEYLQTHGNEKLSVEQFIGFINNKYKNFEKLFVLTPESFERAVGVKNNSSLN